MRITALAVALSIATLAIADDTHFLAGQPRCADLHERIGYTLCYNPARRVADWVAYRVEPAFRETPNRLGRFARFRTDPDISNPVRDSDYTGLYARRGYARGHLAPYAVMGGDRDDDGLLAEDDDDDARTIFEANYMSNIAPQHHNAFNGSGGLWYELERYVQDQLVLDRQETVWVLAGTVFGSGPVEQVGPNADIHVPPMFFKIVAWEDPDVDQPVILAFLFPHQRTSHGEIEDFLVSVDIVEALTGYDFFSDLDDTIEFPLEDRDTYDAWQE